MTKSMAGSNVVLTNDLKGAHDKKHYEIDDPVGSHDKSEVIN